MENVTSFSLNNTRKSKYFSVKYLTYKITYRKKGMHNFHYTINIMLLHNIIRARNTAITK